MSVPAAEWVTITVSSDTLMSPRCLQVYSTPQKPVADGGSYFHAMSSLVSGQFFRSSHLGVL